MIKEDFKDLKIGVLRVVIITSIIGCIIAVPLFLILIVLLIRYYYFCKRHRHMDHMEDLRDRFATLRDTDESLTFAQWRAQMRYKRAYRNVHKRTGKKPRRQKIKRL